MDHIPANGSPRYAEDEEILLSTFPAEVWNMVIPKCNTDSLFLLNNSSHCFRNWLLSKRTAYLFPLVWIILEDYYLNLELPPFLNVSRLEHASRTRDENHEQSPPLPLPTPSLRPVPPKSVQYISPQRYIDNLTNLHILSRGMRSTLEFRLVCKDWCETISRMHLKELDKDEINIKRILENQPTGGKVYWMETKLKANFNFEKFQEVIFNENTFRKSRLIARAIVIENWIPETYNVLEQIGNEVWYCTMVVNCVSHGKERVYLNIKNALKLLPNLRSLEIENLLMHVDFNFDPEIQENDALLAQQLLTLVSQNPMKKLENLQVLQIKDVPSAIFNELIRSNSHVKTLVVERNNNCGIYNIYTERLSAIEELSFAIFKNSELEELSHSKVDWKLTKLHLNVNTLGDFNWSRLFELLSKKWKHTKTRLDYLGHEWVGLGQDFLFTYSLGNRQNDRFGRPF